jgi:hypothetical protein
MLFEKENLRVFLQAFSGVIQDFEAHLAPFCQSVG